MSDTIRRRLTIADLGRKPLLDLTQEPPRPAARPPVPNTTQGRQAATASVLARPEAGEDPAAAARARREDCGPDRQAKAAQGEMAAQAPERAPPQGRGSWVAGVIAGGLRFIKDPGHAEGTIRWKLAKAPGAK